ncbi:MAG: phage baseplate assembly protein V [Pseudomonadota bacterium]
MSRMERPGIVKEYDAEKHMVRLQLNPLDAETPFLSPWVQIEEAAGDGTTRTTPTIGQTMWLISPNGDIRTSKARFGQFSDKYKNGSTSDAETSISRGSSNVSITDGVIRITGGEVHIN